MKEMKKIEKDLLPPAGMVWITQEDGETDEQLRKRVEDLKQRMKQYYPYVEEVKGFDINAEYRKAMKKKKQND